MSKNSDGNIPEASYIPKMTPKRTPYRPRQRLSTTLKISVLSLFTLFLILFILWVAIITKIITSSSQLSQIQPSNDGQSHDRSFNIAPIRDGNSDKIPFKKSLKSPITNHLQSTIDRDDNPAATPVIGTHSLITSSSSSPSSSRNIEMVYALPPLHLTTTTKQPPPIALLLHACTHSSLKFFSPSPEKCPSCLGLSEELAISRTLLRRGYAVAAVTSADRRSGCWGGRRDVDNIRIALNEMRGIVSSNDATMGEEEEDDRASRRGGDDGGIVVAVGASSGGRFAGSLAAEGIVDAAVVMVMALGDEIRSRLTARSLERRGDDSSPSSSSPPPPIYLAPMPRDEGTTRAARKDWEIMTTTTTATETYPVVLDETACLTLPVTHHYLHGRVPNLDDHDAVLIVDALAKAGHIDSRTFFLIKDPTKSDWRRVLQRECGGGDSNGEIDDGSSSGGGCLKNQVLEAGKSPLAKALHRAWAFHEYCSEVVPMALDYIESKLEMNVT